MNQAPVLKSKRFISLDLLRGLAAVGVVVRHAFPVSIYTEPLPYLVDFFFVLSGFVLEPMYPTAKDSARQTRRFIIKRIVRFWPMAITVLTCNLMLYFVLSATGVVMQESFITPASILYSYCLLQIFSKESVLILTPLWSLSAEWIVNILSIPFVLMRKYLVVLIFTGLGFCMLLNYLSDKPFQQSLALPLTGFGGFGRAMFGFGIGIALRIFYESFTARGKKLSRHFGLVVVFPLLLLTVCSYIIGTKVLLIASLCFAPLIWFVAWHDEVISTSRLRNFAITIGELSFGIYAWHYVFYNPLHQNPISSNLWLQGIVNLVAMLSLAVIATRFTQKYVEQPIQRFYNRRQTRATFPASSR